MSQSPAHDEQQQERTPAAEPKPAPGFWHPLRALLWGSVVITLLLAALTAALMVSVGQAGFEVLMQAATPYLSVWRACLLAGIIAFWPQISRWFVRSYQLDEQALQLALRLRWRLAVVLLLVTLVPYIHF